MDPSEIQAPLRNDGRSLHHRTELERAIARLEEKLAAIKREAPGLEFQDDPRILTCLACGTRYLFRPCPVCFPQPVGGA